jgi:hypothetical protein
MSKFTTQFAEIRQGELDDLHNEIRRLRDLIIQIGDVINCEDGGPEQVCLDVWKIIEAEIRLPNSVLDRQPPNTDAIDGQYDNS